MEEWVSILPSFPSFLSHFRYHASDFTQSYMNISSVKKFDAYPVYLILEGASALFFTMVFTVNMVYQATVVNLNPLQLVLVGTVLETTAFLCEVPTGVVADVYSRRLSVIIGIFLLGVGIVTGQTKWKPVFGVLTSWIITLPCAALLSGAAYWLVRLY